MSDLSQAAGALIVGNLVTIGAVLFAVAKAIWWLSKFDSRVEKVEKDVTAAHEKIRDLERSID